MIDPRQGAVVSTRQEAIRAVIQAIVWSSWAVVLSWYGWSIWMLLLGQRSTGLADIIYNWTSTGWLGIFALMLSIRYAWASVVELVGVALPYFFKSKLIPKNAARRRRNER